MRPQEIPVIRGGRFSCVTTVSKRSSVPATASVIRSDRPGIRAVHIGICRVQHSGESEWLVALTCIKFIHPGIHLIPKDAIRGPARCPAVDDEHAPTAHINPDGIRLTGGSSARRTAGPSLAPPAHRGHLRRFTRPAPASIAGPITTTMAAAGPARRCFGQRCIVRSRASPSDGGRLRRHRHASCEFRLLGTLRFCRAFGQDLREGGISGHDGCRPGATGAQVVHVHGGAHAAVRAPAGFHVLRMPEPAPGIRAVFWQLPARVRSKRLGRSRSIIDLRRARTRNRLTCIRR